MGLTTPRSQRCWGPRLGGEALRIGDHLHHRRHIGRQGIAQGRGNLGRVFHSDSQAAHILGDPGEAGLREAAHVPRIPGSFSVHIPDRLHALPQGVVVVHHRHRFDAAAAGRFQFGQVVPQTAVSGEADDRLVGAPAFGPERGGEGPPKRSGAAQVPLCPGLVR